MRINNKLKLKYDNKCTWNANGKYSCNGLEEEKSQQSRPMALHTQTSALVMSNKDTNTNRVSTSDIVTYKLNSLSQEVKEHVIKHIFEQWKEEYTQNKAIGTCKDKVESYYDLMRIFEESKSNTLYVIYETQYDTEYDTEWLGAVAIDFNCSLPSISTPCINHLYVRPSYRNRGKGKMILEWAEQFVLGGGHTIASLWCYKDMEAFYLKHKWSRITTIPNSYFLKTNVIIMGKTLKTSEIQSNNNTHIVKFLDLKNNDVFAEYHMNIASSKNGKSKRTTLV